MEQLLLRPPGRKMKETLDVLENFEVAVLLEVALVSGEELVHQDVGMPPEGRVGR